MTPDLLDDLLDSSAPATRAATEKDLAAMIRIARSDARPGRRRLPRVAFGIGLAAILAGGAGVAVATDGFTWAPWAQDPVGAVSFTMSNGFACELRFSEITGGQDPAFVDDVNRILEDWYRSSDVVGAASAALPTEFAGEDLREVHLEPGETLESLPVGEAEHRLWAQQWMAWDLAVSQLESEELERRGIAPDDERFGGSQRKGQIQCFDESGELYAPGAGS
jgi:hypothetical protein